MNRQRQRAARRRKLRVGDVIWTQTITDAATGELYWFERPENFLPEDGVPPGAQLHGPFKTLAEVKEHERLTLFGPRCEIKQGGAWDPAWEKPQ